MSIYRLLDHPNLCKFIGASVEAPKIAILTEYCPKGSLNDVLQNKEIHLSWGFRFSFADDIAAGMAYLHSKNIFHGRLKSSNCLINDRWVLKITGTFCLCLCIYTIIYVHTVFIRIEAWAFISYKRFLTRHLYEPFLYFT